VAGGSSGERRGRITATLRGLRDLRIELAVLNHRVGARLDIKDLDFDCLDVIAREGPISPSALATRIGVHLATMTGILNRLETGGWVTRGRSDTDRRAVIVASTAQGQRQVYEILGAMGARMTAVCDRYTDEQLEAIADFLHRTVAAGRSSSGEIGEGGDER
jgi:DNA-binding MarR family transcriptional regulator